MASAAVYGDDVAFLQGGLADLGATQHIVDDDLFAARNTGFAHAARHYCGVRGFTAATGQDALRLEEAVNVLGLGFLAH